MRLFPGRLPKLSKKRNTVALLVGAAVAVVITVQATRIQPPVYPVAELTPLTLEQTDALLSDVLLATIPEHLPLALATPFIEEWDTLGFVDQLGLTAAEKEALNSRLLADPVDPLVPALVALSKRHQAIGASTLVAPLLHQHLTQYPTLGSGPTCTRTGLTEFSAYVCSQRQAFHRTVMQGSLWTAWYQSERGRHQLGDLWHWAWWRTHDTRRAGLFEVQSDEVAPKTPSGVRLQSVSATSSSRSVVAIEQRLFPHQTLSCGSTGRLTQTQISPVSVDDTQVIEMCLHELKRRALAEAQLQVLYAKILAMRDLALHNKNMLQFFAWRRQRNALFEVFDMFDEAAVLEHQRMPTFSVFSFENESSEGVATFIQAATDRLSVAPVTTLFALASRPMGPVPDSEVSVLARPRQSSVQRDWVLNAGSETPGEISRLGNVVFADTQALTILGYDVAKTDLPDLWARCVNQARLSEAFTLCTEHQWLMLSSSTPHLGRLYQLTHSALRPGDVGRISYTGPGTLAFWGNGLGVGPQNEISVGHTRSATVTLYAFLQNTAIDPDSADWSFPSLWSDLR